MFAGVLPRKQEIPLKHTSVPLFPRDGGVFEDTGIGNQGGSRKKKTGHLIFSLITAVHSMLQQVREPTVALKVPMIVWYIDAISIAFVHNFLMPFTCLLQTTDCNVNCRLNYLASRKKADLMSS